MIMLNVLQSYYEYSKDERVISLLTNYLSGKTACRDRIWSGILAGVRAGDNIGKRLLALQSHGRAVVTGAGGKIHGNMARWDTA